MIDEYSDGVWLIEFANLSNPDLVPHFVASELGLSSLDEKENRDISDLLTMYLCDMNILIIFVH